MPPFGIGMAASGGAPAVNLGGPAPYSPFLHFDSRDAVGSGGLATSWTDRVRSLVLGPNIASNGPLQDTTVVPGVQTLNYSTTAKNMRNSGLAGTGHLLPFESNSPWTISCRIRWQTGSGNRRLYVIQDSGSTNIVYSNFGSGDNVQNVRTVASATNLVTSSVVSENAWHSVVNRFDGSQLSTFVDGASVATPGTGGGTMSTGVLDLFCIGNHVTSFIQGALAHIGSWIAWDRALSTTEISGMTAYDAGIFA